MTDTDDLAIAIVQRQADAWNAKDADLFAACYTEDAVVRSTVGDDELVIAGREAIRASYGERFRNHPELRVVIEHRHCHEGLVTDLEYFPGREMRATAIFRVRGGLIDRAWIHAAQRLIPDTAPAQAPA
ncbi:SgcJ/EcaC family oxidoreductase [Erythrobacter sp. NE805]|uniref:nuclear transport factor 2 family protein n=1 Tax=Erythrobacter sp. NE805 TaxID=3389875 RepID=UPI00396B24D0